ncbi:AraC family transcriptional regulator [Geitlerinema sp. CS-897]|nr:AraC family transcriptional regulator [Geitlerinema sp. CS-897]
MKPTAPQQARPHAFPTRSNPTREWDYIRVTQFQHPAGEGTCRYDDEHTLSLSLVSRPVQMLQRQAGKTYSGLYGKGDFSITPANTPLFVRWESDDNYLQIRLNAQFLQSVARETFDRDSDRLELIPAFRTRNPQIEVVGMMLLGELQQDTANRLYVDSLANVLAVHLLRQHATTQPQLPVYEGGLPQHQLRQVLEYIDTDLAADIKLSDLASLLDMSPFHFSRLFKQSVGMSPYQYLIHQRIDRAKQLLTQTDRLITDIALQCGFNSHSHLSKQFRQLTGTTPKAYRSQ